MAVKLGDHFTYKKIIRVVISPILMMVFTSLYSIVDGLCVSNFAGADSFAGLNLIFPIIMIVGGFGFMTGAGGSALVSKLLGEGNRQKANEVFTATIIFTATVGIFISVLGFFLIKPIAEAMGRLTDGTTQNMVNEAIKYGRVLILGQFAFMIQNLFQSFFPCDEKAKLGFAFTLASGLSNIVLDLLFVGIFDWGIIGAAVATIIGYIIGSAGPIIYFLTHKEDLIGFAKPHKVVRELVRVCSNGCSEFVNNISSSIVGVVYNIQLLLYFKDNGVSAYGVLMYLGFIFFAVFIGYNIGMAPVVGYHYGAGNKRELQNILKKSAVIIAMASICMFGLCQLVARPFSVLFSSGNAELAALIQKAFRIYSIIFLFCGFSMFITSFFTDLNNGLISAVLCFVRTIALQIPLVFILPSFMGGDGIWWSVVFAEAIALILSIILLLCFDKRYGYIKDRVEETK